MPSAFAFLAPGFFTELLQTYLAIFRRVRGQRNPTDERSGFIASEPSFFCSRCLLIAAYVPDHGIAPMKSGEELGAVGRECQNVGSLVNRLKCQHKITSLDLVQANLVLTGVPRVQDFRGRDRLAVGRESEEAAVSVGVPNSATQRSRFDIPHADPFV